MIIDEIASYLENQGFGTKGEDLFIDSFPAKTENCIVVYTTGGFPPRLDIMHDNTTYQIMVRNNSYSEGLAKINAIKNLFHNKTIKLINYKAYFTASSDIGYLGTDEAGYCRFVINFSCKHRRLI